MAQWLWQKGIKGIFAFDVVVVDEPNITRFVPIECNPRFNGASYPAGIACRLQVPEWIAKEFATRHRTLSDLDLSRVELNPENGVGIILVNWGTIFAGKIGIRLVGPPEVQDELEAGLRAPLAVIPEAAFKRIWVRAAPKVVVPVSNPGPVLSTGVG